MSILVFDIETIPDAQGLEKLELIQNSSNQDVNDYLVKLKQEKGSDFLPLHLHKVIAISCVLRRDGKSGNAEFFVNSLGGLDASEEEIIQRFYSLIDKYQPQLVSWNGNGFDLPVLHYRSLIHNINAYQYWDMGDRKDFTSKEYKYNNYISRYHLRHIDLMDLLAMYQPKAFAKMDDMAKLCNLPGKLGMDGSQVWNEYQKGNLDKIRAYCETDVANTYLLYQKFNGMRFADANLFEQEKRILAESLDNTQQHWQEYLAKLK
jgi:predicted PolB exonuclease-like 3'-5' exonuclease